jgi:hypothetical protein
MHGSATTLPCGRELSVPTRHALCAPKRNNGSQEALVLECLPLIFCTPPKVLPIFEKFSVLNP